MASSKTDATAPVPGGALAVARLALLPGLRRRSSPRPLSSLGALCQYVFDARLVALALTALQFGAVRPHPPAQVWLPLAIALAASYVPLRHWTSLEPLLARRPIYHAVDALLCVSLLAITGPASPFFYYVVASAALGGLLLPRNRALLLAAVLVAGYLLVAVADIGYERAAGGFEDLVGTPALLPLATIACLCVRSLFRRQSADAVRIVGLAADKVAAEERARLAREMHDSLTKTLHGIALSATALEPLCTKDPGTATKRARELSRIAAIASVEARAIISDLRADRPDISLDDTIADLVSSWSDASGVRAVFDVTGSARLPLAQRYELVAIASEALSNTAKHADATQVRVTLVADAHAVVLTVVDNGAGFEVPEQLHGLQRAGHFGLVGMRERAERAAATLGVLSSPGAGTMIRVTVPRVGGPTSAATHGVFHDG